MEFLPYLLTGAGIGVVSGLLGIGGGLIIVPVLLLLLAAHPFPPGHLMHVALGTSLASIVFTSCASTLAHQRLGNVDWHVVRRLAPGVMLGTFAGAWLAALLPTAPLKVLFAAFALHVAARLLRERPLSPSGHWPGTLPTLAAGGGIGLVSSLVGIGGGTMTVPFLLHCNKGMRLAVGTSAAVGMPLAISGALGYMSAGSTVTGMPQHTVGFVYLPAVFGITAASMLTAPLGARLAQALPVAMLRKIFAALLCLLAVKMLWGLL